MRIKQRPYTEQIDKLTYSKKKKSVYSHICAVNATVQQKYSRIVVKKALPSAEEYRASN